MHAQEPLGDPMLIPTRWVTGPVLRAKAYEPSPSSRVLRGVLWGRTGLEACEKGLFCLRPQAPSVARRAPPHPGGGRKSRRPEGRG